MHTYHLQKRILHIESGPKIVFPNEATVEIHYSPNEVFGVPSDPKVLTRTTLVGVKNDIIYDSNTGKIGFYHSPSFNKIDVNLATEDYEIIIKGNIFYIKKFCNNVSELNEILFRFYIYFPMLLSLEIIDPIVVKMIRGKIGNTVFRYQLLESSQILESKYEENILQCMKNSIKELELTHEKKYLRLMAGIYYYYTATRLIQAGNTPYEFFAEALLNYTKSLQALFGESRDDVRAGLKMAGYSDTQINEEYIPIMVIRNEFDVGHVLLNYFSRTDLDALYNFINYIEKDIKELLINIINLVKKDEIKLQEVKDEKDKKKKKAINKIIEITKRKKNTFGLG